MCRKSGPECKIQHRTFNIQQPRSNWTSANWNAEHKLERAEHKLERRSRRSTVIFSWFFQLSNSTKRVLVGCIDHISREINAMFQIALGSNLRSPCSNLCSAAFLGHVPICARLGSNLCSDGNSVTCDSEENKNLFQLDLGSCTW